MKGLLNKMLAAPFYAPLIENSLGYPTYVG